MLFKRQKQSGWVKKKMTPPSLLKLLKPLNILNIEALRTEKFANPEEKKCSTCAVLWPSYVVVWAVFLKGFLA